MLNTNLSKIEEREIVSGFKGKFIHSENLTIAHWSITAGASLVEHNHPHEQVINLIEGKFELIIDGKIQELEPGGVVVIPSNVKHSGKAIIDCYLIDVFYPVRDDFR